MSSPEDTAFRGFGDATHHNGACRCGAVRFEVDAHIDQLFVCACPDCRRANGLLARVESGRFRLLQGKDSVALCRPSAQDTQRYCCGRCETHLFQRRAGAAETIDVNVVRLDDFDPTQLPALLGAEARDDSAGSGIVLVEGVHRVKRGDAG